MEPFLFLCALGFLMIELMTIAFLLCCLIEGPYYALPSWVMDLGYDPVKCWKNSMKYSVAIIFSLPIIYILFINAMGK